MKRIKKKKKGRGGGGVRSPWEEMGEMAGKNTDCGEEKATAPFPNLAQTTALSRPATPGALGRGCI
jgi:hypothetical protein